jgi:hypothetical protein
MYVQMLNTKLLELQEILSISKEANITERSMGVEDELRVAMGALAGTGEGVLGGPYVRVIRVGEQPISGYPRG